MTYYVDNNLSSQILGLVGHCFRAILRWADMLSCRLKVGAHVQWFNFSDITCQGVAVSVSNVDLMERVRRLTNKIYREMLCITTHEKISYVTMAGLNPGQTRKDTHTQIKRTTHHTMRDTPS